MKDPLPPPERDRMSGRYTAYWWRRAIDGPGRYASPPRWRRKKEKRLFKRYADIIWDALKAEEDADNDRPEDQE